MRKLLVQVDVVEPPTQRPRRMLMALSAVLRAVIPGRGRVASVSAHAEIAGGVAALFHQDDLQAGVASTSADVLAAGAAADDDYVGFAAGVGGQAGGVDALPAGRQAFAEGSRIISAWWPGSRSGSRRRCGAQAPRTGRVVPA